MEFGQTTKPELCIKQVFNDKNRSYTRSFNKSQYEKCAVNNAFFVFFVFCLGEKTHGR